MNAANVRPGDKVKALSLWEPWATLMALGLKTVETRHWQTSYRGPLLICAAARTTHKATLSPGEPVYEALADALAPVRGYVPLQDATSRAPEVIEGSLPYGHAVALVDLQACRSTDEPWCRNPRTPLIRNEVPFGDYSPERFGWITANLRRLRPFKVAGQQGLFAVTMPDFEDWS